MANSKYSEAQIKSFAEKQKEVNSEKISSVVYKKITANTYSVTTATSLADIDGLKNKIAVLKEYENLLCSDAQNSIEIPSGVYKPKELIGCYSYDAPSELKKLNSVFLETIDKISVFIDSVVNADTGGGGGHGGYSAPPTGDIPDGITPTPDGKLEDQIDLPQDDNNTEIPKVTPAIIPDHSSSDNGNNNGGNSGDTTQITNEYQGAKNPGTFFSNDGQTIYDESGNEIGTTQKGRYQVYEVKRDANGNVTAVRISPDGEVPERWIRVTNESGLFVASNNNGQFVIEDGTLNVYDENGNLIGQVGPSKYTVYDVMYNEDGSIRAIRISEDGVVPESWIRVGDGNAIAHMEFVGQTGKYTFNNGFIDIVDANGNVVGSLPSGEYPVYDTRTDENGNVIAIRISMDGEDERWINIYENGEYNGIYSSLDGGTIDYNSSDNKAKVSMFGKGSFIVGGIVGVLAIAAGAHMYIKNKKGEAVDELPEGSYDVYDTRTDVNGNVTDAKISPNGGADGDDEYWVHI